MSENVVLWLFGILIGALFALIAFLGRIFWTKLSALDSGALAQFIAKDGEREKSWWQWRDDLMADHTRRRTEIDKRLDAHAGEIKNHENRITRLERNGGPH